MGEGTGDRQKEAGCSDGPEVGSELIPFRFARPSSPVMGGDGVEGEVSIASS